MNISKKSYSVSVKLTRNYQSISLTEGFEVIVDDKFDEFVYEAEKQAVKDRLVEESKKYLDGTISNTVIDL